MPPLTAPDYHDLRQQLFRPGSGKEELKARPSLPNETQLTAAFQVVEDFWEANRATVKANIDTALGFTTSAPLAKKIALSWLTWKMGKGG